MVDDQYFEGGFGRVQTEARALHGGEDCIGVAAHCDRN